MKLNANENENEMKRREKKKEKNVPWNRKTVRWYMAQWNWQTRCQLAFSSRKTFFSSPFSRTDWIFSNIFLYIYFIIYGMFIFIIGNVAIAARGRYCPRRARTKAKHLLRANTPNERTIINLLFSDITLQTVSKYRPIIQSTFFFGQRQN